MPDVNVSLLSGAPLLDGMVSMRIRLDVKSGGFWCCSKKLKVNLRSFPRAAILELCYFCLSV